MQIDSDPTKGLITAYSLINGKPERVLWEINEWARWIDFSNDGHICIIDFTGGLLPSDFKLDEPVLKIFSSGKLLKTLSIRDLLTDTLNLQRTTSHYSWNGSVEYEQNSLTIWTVDSKMVVEYDPFEIKKYKISEQDMKSHGIRKTDEMSRIINWLMFIGK